MKKNIDNQFWIEGFGCIEDENIIWIPHGESNALMKLDKKNNTVECEVNFEKYRQTDKGLFSTVAEIENKLVFVPAFADSIAIYDRTNKVMQYVELQELKGWFDEKYLWISKFYYHIVFGSYLYMFGLSYPMIIKLNVDTLVLECITDWAEEIGLKMSDRDQHGCFTGICKINGNEVAVSVGEIPCLLILDLESGKTRYIFIDAELDGISGLAYKNGIFWIYGRKDHYHSLYKWIGMENRIEKIPEISDIKSNMWTPFWNPIVHDEKLYLVPIDYDQFYIVDLKLNKVTPWKEMNLLIEKKNLFWNTFFAKQIGNRIVFQLAWNGTIYEFDTTTGKYKEYHFVFEDEQYKNEYRDALLKEWMEKKMIREEKSFHLSFWCSNIQNHNSYMVSGNEKKDILGKDIYQTIKN